jgi:Uma2 family endonuclease
MALSDQIFKPEKYTYQDYLLWKGDWELINGYPFAMAPSPFKKHQRFGKTFLQLIDKKINQNCSKCNCESFYELDWVIDNETVIRPDCSIVCGDKHENVISIPPVLIVEIASLSTKLRDRNTKFTLYEMQGVRYYILADTEKKLVEGFELINGKYVSKHDTHFQLTADCSIDLDVFNIWELM